MKSEQQIVHVISSNKEIREYVSDYFTAEHFFITSTKDELPPYNGVGFFLDDVSEIDHDKAKDWLATYTQGDTPLFIIHTDEFSAVDMIRKINRPIIAITITELTHDNMQMVQDLVDHYLTNPPEQGAYVVETVEKNRSIVGVVGLGYVGLPVAVGFSDKFKV